MENRQPTIAVQVAETHTEVLECLRIRYEVYAKELGWEPENDEGLERDDYDETAMHVLASYDSVPCGTMRCIWSTLLGFSLERICDFTLPIDDKAMAIEISRNCVLKEYRGRGVMSAMVAWFTEQVVMKSTIDRIYMLNDEVNTALLRANNIECVHTGTCVEHRGTREVCYIDIASEIERKGLAQGGAT